MKSDGRLGILGGTFDPIHFGHLDAAEAAHAALALDAVQFVPAHDPPHRATRPQVSAYHRFALVALAIDGRPGWHVSDEEMGREGPSYTVDTLRRLHAEGWRALQLFFILGADAFAEIATWREFPAVVDHAHFVVIARPGTTLDEAAARVPALRARMAMPGDPPEAASSPRIFLVNARTRDISSTRIRARLTAGGAVDDLVPAPVARHILAHHLYGAPSRPRAGAPVGAVDDLHGEKQRTHR